MTLAPNVPMCAPLLQLKLQVQLLLGHQSTSGRRAGGQAQRAAVAAAAHLGAQGDLHCICQLLHARQQAGAALISEAQLLGGEATGLEGLEGLQGE